MILLPQEATFLDLQFRLDQQLLYRAQVAGRRTAQGVELLTGTRQADLANLADLLGTTNRSIISVLNRWRADGMVGFDGRRARLTTMIDEALWSSIPRLPARPIMAAPQTVQVNGTTFLLGRSVSARPECVRRLFRGVK